MPPAFLGIVMTFSMANFTEFDEKDYLFASQNIVGLASILSSNILAGVSNRFVYGDYGIEAFS